MQAGQLELVAQTELLHHILSHILMLFSNSGVVSLNKSTEVKGLLIVHLVLCVSANSFVLMILGNSNSLMNSSHQVCTILVNNRASTAVSIQLTCEARNTLHMSQTDACHLVSKQSSVVRSNGGILTSLIQSNLRSKYGNHRTLLASCPVILNNSLNLLRILHVDLNLQSSILNLIVLYAQASVSLCSRTSILIPLVTSEQRHISKVVGIYVRRIEVVVSPQILNESNLSRIITIVVGTRTCTLEVNLLLKGILIETALLNNIPSSSRNIKLVGLKIVEAGSLNTMVVTIGDEYEAAEAALNEIVQHIYLSRKSVNSITQFLKIIPKLLNLIVLQFLNFCISIVLQLSTKIINSLLNSISHLVLGDDILSLKSLNALLEDIQSIELLFDIIDGSELRPITFFETLLEFLKNYQTVSQQLVLRSNLSINLGNFLSVSCNINLLVKFCFQILDVTDYILQMLDT